MHEESYRVLGRKQELTLCSLLTLWEVLQVEYIP